jgi:hypothetical protein
MVTHGCRERISRTLALAIIGSALERLRGKLHQLGSARDVQGKEGEKRGVSKGKWLALEALDSHPRLHLGPIPVGS